MKVNVLILVYTAFSVAVQQSIWKEKKNSDIMHTKEMVFQGRVGRYVQPEVMSWV